MRRALLLVAFVPCLVQAQFGPANEIALSASAPYSIKVVDLNGDGVNDVLVAAYNNHQVAWYPGLGNGLFGAQEVLALGLLNASACDAADLDGDGDLDVVAVGFGADKVVWFRNDGGGNFGAERVFPSTVAGPWSVQATDVDGDGLPEVIVGCSESYPITMYSNLGNGTFGPEEVITQVLYNVRMTATADLDGDGDVDLVSVFNNRVVWYANQGDNTFVEQTLITIWAGTPNNVYTVDVDGDGITDVLTATSGDNQVEWFKNDGAGNFTLGLPIATTANTLRAAVPADLDGDGDIDVIAASSSDSTIAWYENDGSGVFGTQQVISNTVVNPYLVAAGDVDNDGDMDALSSSGTTDRLDFFLNDGNGQFGNASLIARSEASGPMRSLCADLNGDGSLDVLTISALDGKLGWFPNMGDGSTGPLQVITLQSGMRFAHAMDVDGDGDMDILSINQPSGGFGLSLNDGTGQFTPRQDFPNVPSVLNEVTSGDVDGDGDMDILYGLADVNGVIMARNNGDGTFEFPAIDFNTASEWSSPLLVDVDEDGDLDIVVGISPGSFGWLANDGLGNFGAPQLIGDVLGTGTGIHWKDMNGDGHKDLITVAPSHSGIVWFPNLGAGVFGWDLFSISLSYARYVDVADLDGDGDMDIAAIAWFTGGAAYYSLNDGNGHFGPLGTISTTLYGSTHMLAGDMDGDGDPDLIATSNTDDRVIWYENYFGSAYRMEGEVYHDVDGSGTREPGEPGMTLVPVTSDPISSYPLADPDGGFLFYADSGTYVVSPIINNALWQPSSLPASYTVQLSADEPVALGLDFGVQALVDTSIIIPSFATAAGVCLETVNQWISFANHGTRIEHGRVELELDSLFTFNSATPTPDVVDGWHLEWNFSDLSYEEVQAITLSVTRPSADHIGDTLNALLSVLRMDELDNVTDTFAFAWTERFLCSFDPNDKLVTPKGEGEVGIVDIATPYFDYTIRFQNTGSAPARDITLRDHLDPSIDASHIEILGYSYQPTRIVVEVGQEMVVHFDDINLPDSTADRAASQGFITFRAPLHTGLPHATCVENQALIFFDLNEPVITNTVLNTLVDCSLFSAEVSDMGGGQLTASAGASYQWYRDGIAIPDATEADFEATSTGHYSVVTTSTYLCVAESEPVFIGFSGIAEQGTSALRIIPNPARDQALLQSEEVLGPRSRIEVLDPQGRIVSATRGTGGHSMVLDVSTFSAGLYVLRIIDADGVSNAQRFVVE